MRAATTLWTKMPELIIFIIAIAAVIVGADWLGNAATHIANRLSLPRVIIGATIISIATTLPEIVIATISGIEGSPQVGLGTVFGSPFANIGLIFGVLLLFSKVNIDKAYYARTIQFFLIALSFVFLISLGGSISRLFCVSLIMLGFIYLIIQSILGKQEESIFEQLEHRFERLRDFFTGSDNYQQIVYLIIGSLLLVLGAHFLVGSATTLASVFGVPQIVIGLVVIALGTSLPEAFTAVNSIIKDRHGLSAGNLFGASVLDITFALGLASIFNGTQIDPVTLYITVGGLALLASISLLRVFEKIPPRLLGLLLVIGYLIFLVWFSNFGGT